MAYTPDLTMDSSRTLRRIAWALGLPMTETIQEIFSKLLPEIIEKEAVCNRCRDKSRCETCLFTTLENKQPILTIEENKLVLIKKSSTRKKLKKSA